MEQMQGVAKKGVSVDDFLNAVSIKTKTVSIPELGGDVIIRPLSLDVRSKLVTACTKIGNNGKETFDRFEFLGMVVLSCLENPKLELKHLVNIKSANIGIIDKLAKEILALSGIGEETEEERKNVSVATSKAETPSPSPAI